MNFNTSSPKQNDYHFAYIFKYISVNEIHFKLIQVSLRWGVMLSDWVWSESYSTTSVPTPCCQWASPEAYEPNTLCQLSIADGRVSTLHTERNSHPFIQSPSTLAWVLSDHLLGGSFLTVNPADVPVPHCKISWNLKAARYSSAAKIRSL